MFVLTRLRYCHIRSPYCGYQFYLYERCNVTFICQSAYLSFNDHLPGEHVSQPHPYPAPPFLENTIWD